MIKIIDGSNKLHRMFYEGQVSFGVHPLRDFYMQLMVPPMNTIVVWDGANGNKRRRDLYPPYKMNRPEKTEDTKTGFEIMKNVLKYCPVTQIEIPNWEADDVIATLALRFEEDGDYVSIDTNDGDYWQLQSEYITLPILARKTEYEPRYTMLFKALCGDKSDNIPGWKGFGPKSMEAMAPYYDTMDKALREENYTIWQELPWPKRVIADYGTFYECCLFYRLVKMLTVPDEDFEGNVIIGTSSPSDAEQVFHPYLI